MLSDVSIFTPNFQEIDPFDLGEQDHSETKTLVVVDLEKDFREIELAFRSRRKASVDTLRMNHFIGRTLINHKSGIDANGNKLFPRGRWESHLTRISQRLDNVSIRTLQDIIRIVRVWGSPRLTALEEAGVEVTTDVLSQLASSRVPDYVRETAFDFMIQQGKLSSENALLLKAKIEDNINQAVSLPLPPSSINDSEFYTIPSSVNEVPLGYEIAPEEILEETDALSEVITNPIGDLPQKELAEEGSRSRRLVIENGIQFVIDLLDAGDITEDRAVALSDALMSCHHEVKDLMIAFGVKEPAVIREMNRMILDAPQSYTEIINTSGYLQYEEVDETIHISNAKVHDLRRFLDLAYKKKRSEKSVFASMTSFGISGEKTYIKERIDEIYQQYPPEQYSISFEVKIVPNKNN